jgi:hypothetical protein
LSGPITQRMPFANTRQLIRGDDGSVRVRDNVTTFSTIASSTPLAFFHATDDRTGLLYHWLVHVTSGDTYIREWADGWGGSTQRSREALWALDASPRPNEVSMAVVDGQVIFGAPGFPTMHGWIGGPIVPMTRGPSVNTDATTLPIPRGHVCSFASRLVISDGRNLYFSDGLAPRAFVPGNISNPAADLIHGMSLNNAGDLMVHCSDGIYSLARHAAARQIVAGVFSKVTDHRVVAPGTTAQHRGRLWALDRSGVRLVDVPSGQAAPLIPLNDSPVSDGLRVRIVSDDWRYGTRLFSVSRGLMVISQQPECAIFIDLDSGGEKWPLQWSGCGKVIGFAPHYLHQDVFVSSVSGSACQALWGGGVLSAGTYHPVGGNMRLESDPVDSMSLTSVDIAMAPVASVTMASSANGDSKTSAAKAAASAASLYGFGDTGGIVRGRARRTWGNNHKARGADLHLSISAPLHAHDEVDPQATIRVSIYEGKDGGE